MPTTPSQPTNLGKLFEQLMDFHELDAYLDDWAIPASGGSNAASGTTVQQTRPF
ncbi:MAG TPA: hypothetical protein VFU07_04945 [Candidatus Lumbricidophila sp.]|nr:hypothetical protein [Candidatus Lumbricidophila sp.]